MNPTHGTFRTEDLALTGSTPPPSSPAPSSPAPSPTVTPPPPSPTAPAGAGCTAIYRLVGQWQGGFQAEVTVTAGPAAITGWQVGGAVAAGQTLTQIWGGTATGSVIRNAAYNGALAAGAGTTLGFIGTGTPVTPTLTCSAG